MGLSKGEILNIAKKQLALDLACNQNDFDKGENTVVSCDEKIKPWCKDFFHKHKGIDCFEHPIMREIDKELEKYNKKLNVVHELYLPNTKFKTNIESDFKIKIFEKDEITQLYKDKRFKNALIYDENSLRPDVLAVVAYDNNEIVGMAGASADCKELWQIGVDVMEGYKQKGIGKSIVYLLTQEILKRGAIPYYGTWCSNIASRNIAQGCGYFPAWVEMNSVDCE